MYEQRLVNHMDLQTWIPTFDIQYNCCLCAAPFDSAVLEVKPIYILHHRSS